jgi:hypothetical protein
MNMDIPDIVEQSLKAERPTDALRLSIKGLVESSTSRDELKEQLLAIGPRLRSEGTDADEDVLLEVADFLVGWCSPQDKI